MNILLELMQSNKEVQTLFPFSGFIIPTLFVLVINIHKYITSDLFIQTFYSSHTVQLLSKILIPIKFILVNITLTFFAFTILIYWLYQVIREKIQNKQGDFNIDYFFEQVSNAETQKTFLLICLVFMLFIAGLQLIIPTFITLNKNDQLKIRKSSFYISSNHIRDIFPAIPENTNVYLGQKYKKDFILAYYFHDDLPYRITIPEERIRKLIIVPENETKFTSFSEEFKILLGSKALRIFVFFIVPSILFLISKSISDIVIYFLEILLVLSPYIIKRTLKLVSPYFKTLQKKYMLFINNISSFKTKNNIITTVIELLITSFFIFISNLIILTFISFFNFVVIKHWLFLLLFSATLSLILAFIFRYLTSDKISK